MSADEILTALLVVMFTASVAFVAWFGPTRAWWKSLEGCALITSATGWALVSGGFLLDRLSLWAWVGVAAVGALASCLKLAMLVLGHHRKP